VERYRHDTVSSVESFFNAVSVMNVNVDVQDTIVISVMRRNGDTLRAPKWPK
jgi:hypothetical protein